MRTRRMAIVIAGALLAAGTAFAQGHEHEHGGDGGAAAMRDGGGHHDDRSARDEDDDDDDAGPPPSVDRTPAQAAFREKIIAKERAMIQELARAEGRPTALDKRQAIGVHWRHVMRLVRIRELAENGKDTASVARVDALLEREDAKFRARMQHAGAGDKK